MKTTTLNVTILHLKQRKLFNYFANLLNFNQNKIICFALKHPVTSTLHRDDSTKIRFKWVCINGFKVQLCVERFLLMTFSVSLIYFLFFYFRIMYKYVLMDIFQMKWKKLCIISKSRIKAYSSFLRFIDWCNILYLLLSFHRQFVR